MSVGTGCCARANTIRLTHVSIAANESSWLRQPGASAYSFRSKCAARDQDRGPSTLCNLHDRLPESEQMPSPTPVAGSLVIARESSNAVSSGFALEPE